MAKAPQAASKLALTPTRRDMFPLRIALTILMILSAAEASPPAALPVAQGQKETISAPGPMLRAAAEADIPFAQNESDAERLLLNLANQERAKIGVPALQLDPGLSQAARLHAAAMISAHELSHQFEGEASLPQRFAAASGLQLEREGENVAFDFDVAAGHDHLMLSPPHRANLLNPAYNVVGIAVAWEGPKVYIVQDFAQTLPAYSNEDLKNKIVAAIIYARHQAGTSDLVRTDLPDEDDAACSMAQAGKLETAAVRQLARRYTVLAYTNFHPETLPASAAPLLSERNLHQVSIGICRGRSEAYPSGVYWIVVAAQ